MNLLGPISSIMSTNLLTLTAHSTIEDAEKAFKAMSIHHLPVVEGKRLLGIVSKSDIVGMMNGVKKLEEMLEDYQHLTNNVPVEKIMTKGVATLSSTDKINVALEVFKANLFHAIPVVDDGELVGIVTTFDIINQLSTDNEAHAIYSN